MANAGNFDEIQYFALDVVAAKDFQYLANNTCFLETHLLWIVMATEFVAACETVEKLFAAEALLLHHSERRDMYILEIMNAW